MIGSASCDSRGALPSHPSRGNAAPGGARTPSGAASIGRIPPYNRSVLSSLHDRLGRPLHSLRVSVTDRCNLRCTYCMPEEEYTWLERDHLLRFGQLTEVVRAAVQLGTRKVRLTGGEPLLRRELWRLVEQLRGLEGLEDVALTTNGVHLEEAAGPLARAGLSRVTISLDTLDPARFRELTRRDALVPTLRGVESACESFPGRVKVNTVIMAGINDGEIEAMLRWAGDNGAELRFIEYMDVEGATRWKRAQVLPLGTMLERIAQAFGGVTPIETAASAPARRYRLPSGQVFGVVASTTQPFCASCDRARLTADGHLFTCLYGREGLDLATPLRQGEDATALARRIEHAWRERTDQGAVDRLALSDREASVTDSGALRSSPRREMHTKGG